MKTLTLDKFIEKSNIKHNNKYLYLNSIYINNKIKIEIICKIHGKFKQNPKDHLKGKGCGKCGRIIVANKLKFSVENFIYKANLIHNKTYDYSEINYINIILPIEIICKSHGSFSQSPHEHLKGKGCPKCGYFRSIHKRTTTCDKFIEKSRIVHSSLYDYSDVKYLNNWSYVDIICKIHGKFKQVPTSHLNGHGCKKCNSGKYNLKNKNKLINKFGYFYCIKLFNNSESFYKIGITKLVLRKRFSSYSKIKSYNYKFIFQKETTLLKAYNEEQRILSEYKNNKYIPKIKFDGYTECLIKLPTINIKNL